MYKSNIAWTWNDTDNDFGLGIDAEIELKIDYHYYPATPDVMYMSNGDPGYPGDPEEVNVINVSYDGKLSDDLKQQIVEYLENCQLFIDAIIQQHSDWSVDSQEYDPCDEPLEW